MWKVVPKSGPVPIRAREPRRAQVVGSRRKPQLSRGVVNQLASCGDILHDLGVPADCLCASRSRLTTASLFGGRHG
jgi:hypothetical protein